MVGFGVLEVLIARGDDLRVEESTDRWGGTYAVIVDDHGVVEVFGDRAEAEAALRGERKVLR